MAARIHDLGKMILPGEILCRPGLTPIQLDLVQQHARLGYEIIKNVPFPWPVAEIVRQHHERMDGSGYPRGLAETDILLEARILAVADVVEAIAIARPYRSGLGVEAALQEIRRGCGTLYDAAVVDACVILFRLESYEFPDLQKSGGWQPARPLLAPVSAMVSTPPVGPDQNAALAA
jgi:HD-GYP domain-containing protein (c-di-GMP phosphodiesterase class II)